MDPLTADTTTLRRVDRTRLKQVIESAAEHILSARREHAYWQMPAYLGTMFSGQYFLTLKWLGLENQSCFDAERFREVILRSQNENGSWDAVRDGSEEHGNLANSIINYFILKIMGLSQHEPSMAKAREYILSKGGISEAMFLAKVFLALFALYPWSRIPNLPWSTYCPPFGEPHSDRFTQWADPNLKALIYLRKLRISKSPGPGCSLDELWVDGKPDMDAYDEQRRCEIASKPSVGRYVASLIADQQPNGTWGGMSLSSCFAMIVLQDYRERIRRTAPHHGKAIDAAVDSAIHAAMGWMDFLHAGSHEGAYLGVVMDGRYWDTYLAVLALREATVPLDRLPETAAYIRRLQHPGGGFPFGSGYEYAPDNDDTAIAMLALHAFGDDRNLDVLAKAVGWLESMQNASGGWSAFSKNRERNVVVELFASGFVAAVSADPSAADITGHVLEALAAVGLRGDNSEAVSRAIRFLRESQDPETGGWEGKWGVNYIYATSAVLLGLLRAGVDPQDPMVANGVDWLRACQQNVDGGWGESTRSFQDRDWIGRGVSTPTQTAWALLPLIESGELEDRKVTAGINYLIDSFDDAIGWTDSSSVGTGFPGILYMQYPSYSLVFPLMALGRYDAAVKRRTPADPGPPA